MNNNFCNKEKYGKNVPRPSDFIIRNSYVSRRLLKKPVQLAAEAREKIDKCSNLSDLYHFVPIGAETYGAFGPLGLKFPKQINSAVTKSTCWAGFFQYVEFNNQKEQMGCILHRGGIYQFFVRWIQYT